MRSKNKKDLKSRTPKGIGMHLEEIPNFCKQYTTVLEPDKNEPEWWAGAPSVVRTADGIFYLAARMREGQSPRGRRGYANRILKSTDGIHFSVVKEIHRDQAGVGGFERPALVQDPRTKKFRLYGCSPLQSGWGIWKLDDVDDPANFNPKTLWTVLEIESPESEQAKMEPTPDQDHHAMVRVLGYKDPFVIWAENRWWMTVIGFDKVERPYIFSSPYGDKWTLVDENPMLENTGWHSFFTRPSCLLPMAVGYLFVYEGSHPRWYDPTYNIATGLAYTADLRHFIDLTPISPLLMSSTPGKYHTWRYSHWLLVGNTIFVYFEAACPNATNELRVLRLPANFT
jgi:hypothetical protein